MGMAEVFYSAIAFVDDLMQQLNVRYVLVGSAAEYLYKWQLSQDKDPRECRFYDIDFVAELTDEHLEPLSRILGLPPDYILPSEGDPLQEYLDPEIIEQMRARCMCQTNYFFLTHHNEEDYARVHIFVVHEDPSRQVVLQRPQRWVLRENPYVATWLPHVEDWIVGHLIYRGDLREDFRKLYKDCVHMGEQYRRSRYYRRLDRQMGVTEFRNLDIRVRNVECRYKKAA